MGVSNHVTNLVGVAPHDVAMMASSSSFSESVSKEDVPEVPHQPGADFSFPKHSFGNCILFFFGGGGGGGGGRGKQLFTEHYSTAGSRSGHSCYNESSDLVYCHTCLLMFKQKKSRTATKAYQAFVSQG